MKAYFVFFFQPPTDANICATHKVKSTQLRLTAIALDAFLFEAFAKLAVMVCLPVGSSIVFVPSWLALWHTENKGIAFSAGSTLPMWLISVLTGLLLLVMTLYVYKRMVLKSSWQVTGIALLLAGGWNNWLDRTVTGAVTDYIAVGQFPILNCADIFISFACCLLIAYTLLPESLTQQSIQQAEQLASPPTVYVDATTQTVLCASEVAKLVQAANTPNNHQATIVQSSHKAE
jgi:lipoprotein signal peptidase